MGDNEEGEEEGNALEGSSSDEQEPAQEPAVDEVLSDLASTAAYESQEEQRILPPSAGPALRLRMLVQGAYMTSSVTSRNLQLTSAGPTFLGLQMRA